MVKRIRAANALLVAGEQADETVFPALDPATQGIIAEETAVAPQVQTVETNEDTGSLDRGETRATGISEQLTTRVYMTGDAVPGTPPRWGGLLLPCGWAEVVTAAPVPAVAEAVGAGSSTTQVVLGASASGVDQIYRGMPLALTGDMNIVTFIADYDGASKTATVTDTLPGVPAALSTNWQILPNVVYRPASDGIPFFAFDTYLDGVLSKVDVAKGNSVFTFDTRGIGRVDFTYTGRHVSETDVVVPQIADGRPPKPVFRGGVMLLNRKPLATQSFSLDPRVQVELPDDPAAQMGFAGSEVGSRAMQATLNPEMRLIADGGDVMAELLAGNEQIAHLRYGTVAGNRIALTLPRAAVVAAGRGTRGAFRTREMTLDARGANAGAFLAIW